jgi:hypothetical protein
MAAKPPAGVKTHTYRSAAIRRMREDRPNFRRQALTWCFTVGSALPSRLAISLLLYAVSLHSPHLPGPALDSSAPIHRFRCTRLNDSFRIERIVRPHLRSLPKLPVSCARRNIEANGFDSIHSGSTYAYSMGDYPGVKQMNQIKSAKMTPLPCDLLHDFDPKTDFPLRKPPA